MSSLQESGTKNTGPKVLRIGIVQRGKIIEERELKKRESVTIGSSSRCTFQVTAEGLPKNFELFEFDGKGYFLRFEDGIEGRIQLDEEQVSDFKSFATKGQVVQRSGKKAIRLNEKSRGKVMLADGDVTVLFQFKNKTPVPLRPILPPDLRGNFLHNIDTQYAVILAFVAVFQISFIAYARSLPYVEPQSIDELTEDYQRLIMPDRIPEPPKQEAVAQLEPKNKKTDDNKPKKPKKSGKKTAPKKADKDRDRSAKARKDEARRQVAGRGFLKVLGAKGEGGGVIADVFSEGGTAGSLGDAFTGIQGVDIATEGSQAGTRGGGSGESVGVGKLGTQGGGSVKTGKKSEARVTGRLDEQTPEVDGSLDTSAIRRVMNRKKSGIKACYENALKRDRKLAGKLVISFEIDERGRLQNMSFGGSLSSKDVESCIRRISRSWRFPRPDGGAVFVDYPIVFTPSS